MIENIPENLRKEFNDLLSKGDEAKMNDFFIAHLKEFPQEIQDAIITGFVQEALAKKQADDSVISEFRKEALQAAGVLEETKEELKKQVKLAEIRENI